MSEELLANNHASSYPCCALKQRRQRPGETLDPKDERCVIYLPNARNAVDNVQSKGCVSSWLIN
jgi:hypothetical protein